MEISNPWLAQNGIDALATTKPGAQGLVGLDLCVVLLGADEWETISAADAMQRLAAESRIEDVASMQAAADASAVFLFRTREGGAGLLQITSFTANPGSVKIRYKLVKLENAPGNTDTPEQVARNFMTAIRDGDIEAAMKWISPEILNAHVGIRKDLEGMSKTVNEAYAGKLDRLTEFMEWYPQNHDANTRFVEVRVAGVAADDGTGRLHGLYLILSPTPEGWKVAHLDDAFSDKPLSHYVDRIVRILPGEGPLFREKPTESIDPGSVDTPAAREAESASTEEGLAPRINVEVLAVAEIPANGHWWNADGNEVENIYWDDTAVARMETKNNRQVIVRLNSPETDPELKPTMNLSVHRKSTGDGLWGGAGFVYKDRKTLEDLSRCTFSLHDDHPTVEIAATVS